MQNAVAVYCSTVRAFQSRDLVALNAKIPELRLLLSCVVCRQLLVDPYTPGICQHNVCRLCVRGRKQLHPKCTRCNDLCDFKSYTENRSLAWVLLAYKSLCTSIKITGICFTLGNFETQYPIRQKHKPAIDLPRKSIKEFILEGRTYDDVCNKFTEDLPRPMPARLASPAKMRSSLPGENLPITTATVPDFPEEPALPEAMYQEVDQHQLAEMEMEIAAGVPDVEQHYLTATQSDIVDNLAHGTIHTLIPIHGDTSMEFTNTPFSQASTMGEQSNWVQFVELTDANVISDAVDADANGILSSIETVPTIEQHVHFVKNDVEELHVSESPIVNAVEQAVSVPIPIVNAVEQTVSVPIPIVTNEVPTTAAITSIAAASSNEELVVSKSVTASSMQRPQTKRKRNSSANDTAESDNVATSNAQNVVNKGKKKKKANNDADEATASATEESSESSPEKGKKNKRLKCRCGGSSILTARRNFTCFRQRCPCYASQQGCINCNCVGCHNPYKADGSYVTTAMTMTTDTSPQHEMAAVSTSTVTTSSTTGSIIAAQEQSHSQMSSEQPTTQPEYPPVLIQNDDGQYQPINLFNEKGQPLNPATLNLESIELQTISGNTVSTITAYVIKPGTKVLPLNSAADNSSATSNSVVASSSNADVDEQRNVVTKLDQQMTTSSVGTAPQSESQKRRPQKMNVISVETITGPRDTRADFSNISPHTNSNDTLSEQFSHGLSDTNDL